VGDVAGALVANEMNRTLNRYIFHEIWPSFLTSLFVSIFIVVATKMLSITELIVTQGVRGSQVIGMITYLLPDIISFALPAATLIAVVVAFLRLSGDSEIIALKSSGVSLYQMLPPVVMVSFLGFLIAIVIGVIAVPWGNRSFKDLIFKIAESKADLGIKERIFCEPFENIIFYVNSFSTPERLMKDVFVVDRRDKDVTNTIVAKEARMFFYSKQKIITLRFKKGTIFMVEKNLQSGRTIEFNSYDLNIGLKDIISALASREKSPKEMAVGELMAQVSTVPRGETRYNEMMIELLEKCTIPFAVFFMGIIGVPLGAHMRAKGRTAGVGISLVVFIIYYMCLAGVRNICETGVISPIIGVWIPVMFLFVSCIYLLRRVANERPIGFLFSSVPKPSEIQGFSVWKRTFLKQINLLKRWRKE
jgi:lipopolysaccharide export system permease protein